MAEATIIVCGATLLLFILFLISFLSEPRRLVNGVLFNLFLLSFLIAAAALILQSRHRLLIAVAATLFVIFMFVILAIFALHLVWLLWNAIVVWRREGHSLGNMLTFFLFLALALLELGATFGRQFLPTWLYAGLAVFFTLTIAYLLLSLYNFLTVLVLYNLRWPRHNKDYLIVLGAGLLNGTEVSPLLAARINAGIKFYQKQLQKTGKRAKMIFSGGQGGDEQLAEGEAMMHYAVTHGMDIKDTIVEDRSTTTFENMKFSKALIVARQQGAPFTALFFTNNYHLFRAGVYARLAGLKANGVGAPTSFYFLPNAVIREFLALVLLNKRRHLIVFGGIVILAVLLGIAQIGR